MPKPSKKPSRPGSLNPDKQPWVRSTLRGLTSLLTVICLIDCFFEGISQGTWNSYIAIYPLYHAFLTAYSVTREAQKWTRKELKEDKSYGEKWLWAWGGLVFVLWVINGTLEPVYWPRHLFNTIIWVLGLYTGTRISGSIRSQMGVGDGAPDAENGDQGNGGQGPEDSGQDTGDSNQGTGGSDSGPTADNQKMDKGEAAKLVRQVCQELGTFTIEQVIEKTSLPLTTVNGCIGRLVQLGFIQKGADDKFHWIGPQE